MRRTLRFLALLLALLLVVGACGDDGDEDAGGDTGDGEDAAADFEGETIEVAAVWSGAEQEAFQQVLNEFEEQTGAEVTFRSTGDQIGQVLGTAIEGGDPPDVAMLPQPGLLKDLAEQGALQPIEDVAGELVDEHYAPVWRELGSVNDTLYGVWFKAANKSTVWYNTSVFEDAGVEPPETWDEFMQTAETIANSGVTPVSIGGGDGWTLTDWFENVYLRTAGPELYDQLTNHEIPWTHESVKNALRILGELWSRDELIVDDAVSTSFPESVAQVFQEPPEGAIVYEGDFVAGVIEDETEAVVGEDADFFSFPSIDDSPPAVVGGGDVAVLLTENEAAKELIRFLAKPESAEVWAEIGGYTSPNRDVDVGTYPNETAQRSAEALTAAETFRFDMSDLAPSEFGGEGGAFWTVLQDFLNNPSDVDAAAQRLEQAAQAAYSE